MRLLPLETTIINHSTLLFSCQKVTSHNSIIENTMSINHPHDIRRCCGAFFLSLPLSYHTMDNCAMISACDEPAPSLR